jgi:MAC/Perforin domain
MPAVPPSRSRELRKDLNVPNTQPQLTLYATNGYNAKEGDFLGSPIFTLTYNDGKTTNWGPPGASGTISTPDQLSAHTSSSFYQAINTLLMETTADYDRSYSASVQAEYSGVAYSGSVSGSLFYRGDLFQSTSSTYGLNQYLQTVLTFERLPVTAADLDPGFVSVLVNLPTDISSPAAQKQYFAFFRQYGTHYPSSGTMGGTIVMETTIANSLIETTTVHEVSTAITAGYSGMISSGSISTAAAYSSSEFLSNHRNQILIQTTTIGGLYSPGELISAWAQSLYTTPALVFNVPRLTNAPQLTQLECVSNLVSIANAPSTIAENIETMVSAYITPLFAADGLLGTLRTIPIATAQQLLTGDGFIVGTVRAQGNGDRSWIRGFDDGTSNPTTLRACASQHLYVNEGTSVPSASFFMPAPNNSTYLAPGATTSGNPMLSLQFAGAGNIDDTILQTWQSIELNTTITAPGDGFVVGTIDWNGSNGSRGYILGATIVNGVSTTIAGASQHLYYDADIYVPCNSFTMPVRKNTSYEVTFTVTSNYPQGQGWYIPLNPESVQLGASVVLQPGVTYPAQTDGFLLAYLTQTTGYADRASINLYSSRDQAAVTAASDPVLVTSTSMQQPDLLFGDVWVPCNSATIPVRKGNYYQVTMTTAAGSPAVNIRWFPLTAA